MTPRRPVAVLALCLAIGLAVPSAEAKPSCPLLSDEAGDAKNISKPVADDPALDFTSADMVSDRTRLTVVMRVVAMVRPSSGTAGGATYDYGFRIHNTSWVLRATYRLATGDRFSLLTEARTDVPVGSVYEWTPTPAHVDGVVDEDLSEIRMSVALKDLAGAAPGLKVSGYRLVSWMEADDAVGASSDFIYDTRASYLLGQRGCIPVKI